jgi:hypothetical protein
LLGQEPSGQVMLTVSYSLIGTTIAGTAVYLILDYFLTERTGGGGSRRRETLSARRQSRRRNPIRLGK